MYSVESDIPVPKQIMGRKSLYPFALMQPGDSFAFSLEDMRKVRSAASAYARRNGGKYIVLEGETEGRCWRMS